MKYKIDFYIFFFLKQILLKNLMFTVIYHGNEIECECEFDSDDEHYFIEIPDFKKPAKWHQVWHKKIYILHISQNKIELNPQFVGMVFYKRFRYIPFIGKQLVEDCDTLIDGKLTSWLDRWINNPPVFPQIISV